MRKDVYTHIMQDENMCMAARTRNSPVLICGISHKGTSA